MCIYNCWITCKLQWMCGRVTMTLYSWTTKTNINYLNICHSKWNFIHRVYNCLLSKFHPAYTVLYINSKFVLCFSTLSYFLHYLKWSFHSKFELLSLLSNTVPCNSNFFISIKSLKSFTPVVVKQHKTESNFIGDYFLPVNLILITL